MCRSPFSAGANCRRSRDNVVVVLHALTGDSHITGPAGPDHPTAGWWDGVAGPGGPIDTDRWCAVATNVLGGCRGSTGPELAAPGRQGVGLAIPTRLHPGPGRGRHRRPGDVRASPRSPRSSAARWAGPGRWSGWSAIPDTVRSALVLAVGARATADQVGTQSAQVAAIKADPNWQNGDYYGTGRSPDLGMEIARRFAHLTYRGEVELDDRFANDPQGGEDPAVGGRYSVQSYLEYQGRKLVARFDAGTYVALTESLSSHDVGRGRGGIEAALRSCPVPAVVGGITSDRLYPLRLQEELAELLPGCAGLERRRLDLRTRRLPGGDRRGRQTDPPDAGAGLAVTRSDHDQRSLSFGAEAAAYERGRPSYPPEAIDWLLPPDAARGARPRRGHRQADHPAGRTRPRRGRGRSDPGNARAAEQFAARHASVARHRRGDPAARRQRRRRAGGAGVALVRSRARDQGGEPRAAARRSARPGVEHPRRAAGLGEGSGPDHRPRGRPVQPQRDVARAVHRPSSAIRSSGRIT